MSKEKFEIAKSVLGRPAFELDNVAIYNIDCIQGMMALPSHLFDLTITSPPYNIGKEYEEIAQVDDYVAWSIKWMDEVYRTTAEKGSFWLNVGYFEVPYKGLAVPISYLLWDKTPFYFIQEVVWNYSAGVACRKRLSPRNEKLLWYVKDKDEYVFNLDSIRDPDVKYPNQKKNGKLKCNPLGKNPSDVWQISKVTSGQNRSSIERTPHPAQFPMEMVERMMLASSNSGDLILDPFMGSGSTAECAMKNDRFVIGFEVEPKYIGYISDRLSKKIDKDKLESAQIDLGL